MQVLKYINVLHLITKVQLIILKIRIFKTLFQKALHKIGGLFDENFIIFSVLVLVLESLIKLCER